MHTREGSGKKIESRKASLVGLPKLGPAFVNAVIGQSYETRRDETVVYVRSSAADRNVDPRRAERTVT